MSLSMIASSLVSEKSSTAKTTKAPRPWTVFQVKLAELAQTGMAEDEAKPEAQSYAIEGYFGPMNTVEELQALLLGLGWMVAKAPRGEDGYIIGLKGFRRPWKSMFGMALSGLLPSSEDFSILLTWADVLWASDLGLSDMVRDKQAEIMADPEEVTTVQAELAAYRAEYRAAHGKA